MVLANVGLAGSLAMAAISLRCCRRKLWSNAGMKCSVLTLSNGGISNGVVHLASSGLLLAPSLGFASAALVRVLPPLAFRFAAVGLPLLLAIVAHSSGRMLEWPDLCRLFAALSRRLPPGGKGRMRH